MSGFATNISHRLLHSLDHQYFPIEVISIDALLESLMTHKILSMKIENKQFQLLFDASSILYSKQGSFNVMIVTV